MGQIMRTARAKGRELEAERTRLITLLSNHYPELVVEFLDMIIPEELGMPPASPWSLDDYDVVEDWPGNTAPSFRGESAAGTTVMYGPH